MQRSGPSTRIIPMVLISALFGSNATAEIKIDAEVLSSTTISTIIRFNFSGDLSGLTPEVNLRSFVFIDFTESPGLKAAFPATVNEFNFTANTVVTEANRTINKVEIRNNEVAYFDRVSFAFDGGLTAETTFPNSSTLEVEFPTRVVITTADFNNLPVYWCFPNWGTNQGRGTLAGITNPISDSPAISITKDVAGQTTIEFTGILESSPNLLTPFTPVPGATSPYLILPNSPSRQFFRVSRE